jgi:hypothetical protein
MSKDYCGFVNEDSKTAFLSGVVDVLGGNLSMICDFPHTLETDIFYIKDGDVSLINSSMKNRLHSYNEQYGLNIPYEKIESLDIILEKKDCNVNSDFLRGQLEAYSSNPKLKDSVNEFLSELEWYLGKPLGIYFPVRLNDKNLDILAKIYLYIAYQYFFISYGEYIILLIIGSVE